MSDVVADVLAEWGVVPENVPFIKPPVVQFP